MQCRECWNYRASTMNRLPCTRRDGHSDGCKNLREGVRSTNNATFLPFDIYFLTLICERGANDNSSNTFLDATPPYFQSCKRNVTSRSIASPRWNHVVGPRIRELGDFVARP